MPALKNSTSRIIFPVWKNSTAAEVTFNPLTKRNAYRILHDARRLERQTRNKKNHQDGRIGRNGFLVLFAMLTDCLDYVTGQLTPSYETIARRANISVRSVARGLQNLKDAGVLTWIRRCSWNDKTGQLQQDTNAYHVAQVSAWKNAPQAPLPDHWGQPEKIPDALSLAVAALDIGRRATQAALDLGEPGGLTAALAGFNRTRSNGL